MHIEQVEICVDSFPFTPYDIDPCVWMANINFHIYVVLSTEHLCFYDLLDPDSWCLQ